MTTTNNNQTKTKTLPDRTAVIEAYVQVWAEPDAAKLPSLLSHFWTAESTYEDPQTPVLRGADALISHISSYHTALPGAHMALNSVVEDYHHVGRFNWIQHRADGTTTYGTDFVEFDDQNNLVRVVGFFSHLARQQL